jgi:hypothetical protein
MTPERCDRSGVGGRIKSEVTLSAASRMGHHAKAEMRRGLRRRWVVVAGLVVVAVAIVSSVLALMGSGSPNAGVVPHGVRKIDIRSAFPDAQPVASYSITDPVKIGRITGLLKALDARKTTYDGSYGLGVAGIRHNQMCPAIAGPTAILELKGAGGTVLASASFVTGPLAGGLSAACNPLWFSRGQAAEPGGAFHPQVALAGHDLQYVNFGRQLQQVIGRPLCQRDVGASAYYCKP